MQKSVRAMLWAKMHNLKDVILKRTLISQKRSQAISTINGISMCRIPGGTTANIDHVDIPSKPDLTVENSTADVTEINTNISIM